MSQRRAKNLDDQAVETVVRILDGWTGKLSWELFSEAIYKRTAQRYTRQALHNHARIVDAFQLRKRLLAEAADGKPRQRKKNPAMELDATLQQLDLLKGENERLQDENNRLLTQFVRWAYNAYTRGLDKRFLDQPLPSVNRDPTDMRKLGRKGSMT
jgi:hypothetical protein